MKNNQSGRSMVEMLGVLAIIGVLSAGGLAGYSKAMFKHKLNSTMDQLTMLVTNIRTMYGTQESYENLSVSQAASLGIIAQSSLSGSVMVNPFKGNVYLKPSPAKADVANSGFVIAYDGLPKEACIALATADWGTGAGSGFIKTTAAAATDADDLADTLDGAYSGVAGEGEPLKVSQAIGLCGGATNAVAIKFY